jgi:hypothetical protein
VLQGFGKFAQSEEGVMAQDANGNERTFRACMSDGGVYLSVWPGKIVDGRRLWSGFRLIDMDLDEEDCSPQEKAH